MFRAMVASGLVAALQVAAVQGLFLHAHVDDHDTAHHRGRAIHAHVSEHTHEVGPLRGPAASAPSALRRASPEPWRRREGQPLQRGTKAIGDIDAERIVALQVFVAVEADGFDTVGVPEYGFTLDRPLPQAERRPPIVVHTHDPPFSLSLPARAPPATARC